MYFLIQQEMLKTQNLLLITQMFVFIYFIYLFISFHFICFKVQQLQQNSTNVTGGANVVQGRIANYNKGFAARKALLGTSSTVNCEIALNRYSFFEALADKLLPNKN